MGDFSEDPIETNEDWQEVLGNGCCCTGMPTCADISVEFQLTMGRSALNYVEATGSAPDYSWHRKKRVDYSDGGFSEVEYDQAYSVEIDGNAGGGWGYATPPGSPNLSSGTTPPTTGTTTTTYTTTTPPAELSAALADFATSFAWDDDGALYNESGGFGYASYRDYSAFSATYASPMVFDLQRCRFRFIIPDGFLGSYYKITWDLADKETTVDGGSLGDGDWLSYAVEGDTWEWAGPGDPEDPDSWKSPWFDMDLPTVNAIRKIVNIRYQCQHGTQFGAATYLHGDQIEIP